MECQAQLCKVNTTLLQMADRCLTILPTLFLTQGQAASCYIRTLVHDYSTVTNAANDSQIWIELPLCCRAEPVESESGHAEA